MIALLTVIVIPRYVYFVVNTDTIELDTYSSVYGLIWLYMVVVFTRFFN